MELLDQLDWMPTVKPIKSIHPEKEKIVKENSCMREENNISYLHNTHVLLFMWIEK